MLRIIFGRELDGYESPKPRARCGEVVLGPLGLLNVLETRLGLRGNWEGEAVRTVQFLQCLRAADDGDRFYSRSMAVDELSVARCLLRWRDVWVKAGWEGTARGKDSPRLLDMAAVERHAREHLSPGGGDRLRAALNALQENPLKDLVLELVDRRDEFSHLWQQILSRLSVSAHPSSFQSTAVAPSGSDLSLLQQALLINRPTRLRGDGTVIFLSAPDDHLLARGVSQILNGNVRKEKSPWFCTPWSTTVVDGGRGATLDLVFEGDGHPLTGSSQHSRWRPTLQVLPLALSLFWAPLDPHRLLEFLALPICPLPRRIRSHLAQVVSEYPGMGGQPWREALAEIMQRERERKGEDPAAEKALRQKIDQWLFADRYDPEDGAPVQQLAEQCARVARWAAGQAERADISDSLRGLFFAATAQSSQAQRTLDSLAAAGRKTIDRLQLERLIDQVTSQGTAVPALSAELGHMHCCRTPGAVIESNERVLWWDFCEPDLPGRWPWSAAEQGQLAENGGRLLPVKVRLQRQAEIWVRPVLGASRQVVFALPAASSGEMQRRHPLWNRIVALTGDTVPTIDIGSLVSTEKASSGLALSLSSLPRRSLPQPVRWWQIDPPQLLAPREKESFSSLQCFLESPYIWVLRYKAKLYAGSLAKVEEGNRQKGNLFHRLFELLFTASGLDWRQATMEEVINWVSTSFETLLETEGANYLLPGRRRDKQELAETARRSTWSLIAFLRAAKVEYVEVEKPVAGTFAGGLLTGYIDLLVRNENGEEAVVDLKWDGARYRANELRKNRMLQLAVYAYLRKREGRWPAQAFYLINECRLLAQDERFFPNVEVCSPADENDNAASLCLGFEKTWRWRRGQLDRGQIEVTVTGTSADEDSTPPTGGLPIDEHSDRFNEFASLTGWGEES